MCSSSVVPACLSGIDAKSDGIRFGGTHERLAYVGVLARGAVRKSLPALLFDHAQPCKWRQACRRSIRLITSRNFRALCRQMKIGQKVHGKITPQRDVAVAAVPADSGDLDRALIEVHVVGLIRLGRGMRTSDGNVDRSIDRDADIDEGA